MATGPIDADGQPPFKRVLTGIPGLNIGLREGFHKAGIYIVRGYPGTSKTRGWSAATIVYSRVSPRGGKK